ncbi:hypothetical protein [Variovorax paradoxus]|uniref:hypothetical protein n=1 Tax=Variovorax paradoxus TaxID=34073 RepID=UPI002480CC2A|nr:hypothetical protein [Variovorax paradoxus]WGT64785.1 hypothetical protein QHG62_05440 [Variovorax paradoxus]
MSKVDGTRSAPPRKRVKTGGRAPGTPNKATKEFRDTITKVLDANADNVGKWLSLVAEGRPANTEAGIAAEPGDPAKALDLLTKLAEYAAPKLARTEHTGKNGGPLETVTRIELVAGSGDSED